ncbi:hypothetical protein [Amycolatopsis sp. FDAARGOS 1241]|uniref:hypothetical protein n=1 Tax=Amycolatopsis sp. FDAARGOS 1241 TaxID=2778070 RepID=UPI00195115C1|nr:hypothetical protein [Amycolatopsis sp. FDAARGOS 1241]QRP50031.1 hypothetical protein I6J71_21315 [Amycolatopsis sp. FDAARGOS 1241]
MGDREWPGAAGQLAVRQWRRLLPREPAPRLTDATPLDPAGINSVIKAGLKGGLHFERREVHNGLWCCSVALEPTGCGGRLALAAVCPESAMYCGKRRSPRSSVPQRSRRESEADIGDVRRGVP